jgi:DNA-binding beta-propeller fold protein YncE
LYLNAREAFVAGSTGMSFIRRVARSKGDAGWLSVAMTVLAAALSSFLATTPAQGSTGYELGKPDPVLVGGIEFPHGVAVDQANHRVYVAVVSDHSLSLAPGEVRRFESNGDPAGTFFAGPEALFSGVAVNPVTQGFYASQVRVETPIGNAGVAQIDPFSAAGTPGTPFPVSVTGMLPQIATNSSGDVYFPDAATHSVQVFDSAGVLQETIGCGDCSGGAFGRPASLAVDSNGDLYVVDFAPDRVVKLTLSGGSYEFDSVLQSGRGAVAVAVDPSTHDVLVGDFPGGTNYHVIAYNSSGSQFDDFGVGSFIDPPLGASAAAQIAVDATTHKLYFGETNKILVFDRVTISPPSATINPASAVVQLGATLNATVNAKGHAALECDFEYTDEVDFLTNEFANASSLPCPKNPDGLANTAVAFQVSGLSPGTAYRYRLTVTTNAGSVTTGSQSFETLPQVPPTVTTEPAFSVTQTAATVKGRFNPHGGSISSCQFELGTSLSYGSSIPCPLPLGPVTTDVVKSKVVGGLKSGTAYHYRLVVSTNAGTIAGKDVEFTTVSTPAVPEPESTAPPPVLTWPVDPPPVECGRGFRRQLTGSGDRCVRVCKRGFRKKRVRGKVRCVKKRPPSRHRRGHAAP